MPEDTSVERCYKELINKGYPKAMAAKICQSQTGLSLKTGKPPKKD